MLRDTGKSRHILKTRHTANVTGESTTMGTYLILTTRTPHFDTADLARHYEHLDRLRATAQLGLSGGFTDATGGAYVVTAETLDEARAIAAADPLIAGGSSTATVKEWNVASR